MAQISSSLKYPLLSLLLSDDARLFGFVRITTGDAMSKRAKFTLITWIGENVSGLQRAKISTDKTLVKDIVQVGFAFPNSITHAICKFSDSDLQNLTHPDTQITMYIFTVNKSVHSCKQSLVLSLHHSQFVCSPFSMQNFAKEFMISDPRELEEDYLRNELKKAGGANYDAQAE